MEKKKCRFAECLKSLRKEKGLSQEELGKFVSVTGATVSRWEAGLVEPDYQVLINLSVYFCVSTDYLLGIEY